MPFQILHNDITNMETDAIVNAANSNLIAGGGVCGAIFSKAGKDELQKECNLLSPCPVGHAVITKGYNLKSKYIIHAVLKLAKDYNLKSIAFPLISAGIYGYPKKEALNIAVTTIKEFLQDNDMDIYLVVFNREVVCLSEKLYHNIKHYIDDFYEDENYFPRNINLLEMEEIIEEKSFDKKSLENILDNMDETFSQMLLRLIEEKGKTDVEIYKKANMDRKLFSKIRSNKDYNPKKTTALSLAIALELSLDETNELLSRAGYSLSHSHKFDLIIEYFIKNKNYDIFTINEALFAFEQPLLAI